MSSLHQPSLADVATYLAARREAVLNNWRGACESDPSLSNATSLSREEFNNKVPFLLNVLEQRLRQPVESTDDEVGLLAAEHGLHRWQKGYALHELAAEMQHLNRLLLVELRQCWQSYPTLPSEGLATAYEYLATFNYQITTASLEQYTNLQRQTAASRAEALEKTLTQLNEISQQRSDRLRQSSHDLRSSFGIMQGATDLLSMADESTEERQQFLAMLQRNLTNSRALVSQLIDLARLEASQEHLQIQSFNAGQLLTHLLTDYQPLAQERGLLLQGDGPSELTVESDPVHLQRILQNLVLNALKHTTQGWVSVSWSRESDYRWIVSVQDSGPGLPTAGEVGSLPQVLAPTAESTAAFGLSTPQPDAQEAANTQASGSVFAHKGEGIGLSIVKGLCELLRASLEIESKPGVGTLFRLRLPMHWQS